MGQRVAHFCRRLERETISEMSEPDFSSIFKTKKKRVSVTPRTLKWLRDLGYVVDVAESYNAYTKRSKDLYGFIDVMAVHPDKQETLAVQVTTGSNLSARIKKAEALDGYWAWLAAGNAVEFHGWRKLKGRWEPRIVRFCYLC